MCKAARLDARYIYQASNELQSDIEFLNIKDRRNNTILYYDIILYNKDSFCEKLTYFPEEIKKKETEKALEYFYNMRYYDRFSYEHIQNNIEFMVHKLGLYSSIYNSISFLKKRQERVRVRVRTPDDFMEFKYFDNKIQFLQGLVVGYDETLNSIIDQKSVSQHAINSEKKRYIEEILNKALSEEDKKKDDFSNEIVDPMNLEKIELRKDTITLSKESNNKKITFIKSDVAKNQFVIFYSESVLDMVKNQSKFATIGKGVSVDDIISPEEICALNLENIKLVGG